MIRLRKPLGTGGCNLARLLLHVEAVSVAVATDVIHPALSRFLRLSPKRGLTPVG